MAVSDRTKKANKLGKGSFAKVYRGECNDKPCAVKIFKDDVCLKKELSPDPGDEPHLMLPKVQHPNIVQEFGMWQDNYRNTAAIAIVMELCDESLSEFINSKNWRGKPVPEHKLKLTILRDIAKGMSYLHSRSIIHGNLHTGNVLLCHSNHGTVTKLTDFNMARYIDSDRQRFTTKFKPDEYFPPEVFGSEEYKTSQAVLLTPKFDVFCYGELALEVACGTYPTPDRKRKGHNEMPSEVQCREKYLVKLKQSGKEAFDSLIRKCLVNNPEGRPSFPGILRDVERYLLPKQPDVQELQDKAVSYLSLHVKMHAHKICNTCMHSCTRMNTCACMSQHTSIVAALNLS